MWRSVSRTWRGTNCASRRRCHCSVRPGIGQPPCAAGAEGSPMVNTTWSSRSRLRRTFRNMPATVDRWAAMSRPHFHNAHALGRSRVFRLCAWAHPSTSSGRAVVVSSARGGPSIYRRKVAGARKPKDPVRRSTPVDTPSQIMLASVIAQTVNIFVNVLTGSITGVTGLRESATVRIRR